MFRKYAFLALCIALLISALHSQAVDPVKEKADEAKLVQDLVAARQSYQKSLVALYQHYDMKGDRERSRWAEEELKNFHLTSKYSFRTDIADVPQEALVAKENIKEANDMFREAMKYKEKGTGTEYILNQRRCELLLQEILVKHKNSDKIADVAYQLGELYEGRAFKQYERAAAYFERVAVWKKGSRTDARLRAAYIYDKILNERSKAVNMYREEIANDTDPERIKFAESRIAELTSSRK